MINELITTETIGMIVGIGLVFAVALLLVFSRYEEHRYQILKAQSVDSATETQIATSKFWIGYVGVAVLASGVCGALAYYLTGLTGLEGSKYALCEIAVSLIAFFVWDKYLGGVGDALHIELVRDKVLAMTFQSADESDSASDELEEVKRAIEKLLKK